MPVLDILDLVFALLGIGISSPGIRLKGIAGRWFWKRVSAGWPATQASMLSGRVEQSQGCWVVSAPYSFYAAGERYGGRYEREFASEARAQEALERLRLSSPVVRYRPGNPDRSVLDVG
ncbi:MAG: hypothetical protein ACLQGV_13620 [Bryobacteraceae bacterium]